MEGRRRRSRGLSSKFHCKTTTHTHHLNSDIIRTNNRKVSSCVSARLDTRRSPLLWFVVGMSRVRSGLIKYLQLHGAICSSSLKTNSVAVSDCYICISEAQLLGMLILKGFWSRDRSEQVVKIFIFF